MNKVWIFILALLLVCTTAFLKADSVIASADESMQAEMESDEDQAVEEENAPSSYEEGNKEAAPDDEASDGENELQEEEQYTPDAEEGRT